jgi:hypothetical protein
LIHAAAFAADGGKPPEKPFNADFAKVQALLPLAIGES